MSLADDLRKAKALIDTPEKWVKGAYRNASGCLCAVGAVMVATGTDPDGVQAGDKIAPCEWLLVAELPDHLRTHGPAGIVVFNDAPSTTHADIMVLFNRAIAAASPTDTGARE